MSGVISTLLHYVAALDEGAKMTPVIRELKRQRANYSPLVPLEEVILRTIEWMEKGM